MIEVVVVIWLSCFVLSAILVTWNYQSLYKKINSIQLSNLNKNLKKINHYWSLSSENFEILQENSIQLDLKKSQRSVLLLGLLGLIGLPGLILLFLVTISLKYLVVNRKAKAVFKSDLVLSDNLSLENIQKMFTVLNNIG